MPKKKESPRDFRDDLFCDNLNETLSKLRVGIDMGSIKDMHEEGNRAVQQCQWLLKDLKAFMKFIENQWGIG